MLREMILISSVKQLTQHQFLILINLLMTNSEVPNLLKKQEKALTKNTLKLQDVPPNARLFPSLLEAQISQFQKKQKDLFMMHCVLLEHLLSKDFQSQEAQLLKWKFPKNCNLIPEKFLVLIHIALDNTENLWNLFPILWQKTPDSTQ